MTADSVDGTFSDAIHDDVVTSSWNAGQTGEV
jgi:hypothetical protein